MLLSNTFNWFLSLKELFVGPCNIQVNMLFPAFSVLIKVKTALVFKERKNLPT